MCSEVELSKLQTAGRYAVGTARKKSTMPWQAHCKENHATPPALKIKPGQYVCYQRESVHWDGPILHVIIHFASHDRK